MRTFSTRFIPTAAVLAVAMLFGAPAFAQTGASNLIPNAGSKQDPQADNPVLVKTTPEERQAARAKRKAERAAGGPTASNPVNPKSNPTGSAETSVQTSATPQSRN